MRIELDLSQAAEWAAGLPTWAWVAAAVHTWYLAAGLVIRWMGHGAGTRFADESHQTFWWVLSPLFALFVLGIWLPVSLSSGFLVPPPWRAKWRYAPTDMLKYSGRVSGSAKEACIHDHRGCS